jgi:hypothetical protein
MLCDEAGKPLPPSECRMLRAWVGAWFAGKRRLLLVEPTVRKLPPDNASAAARKAAVMKLLFSGLKGQVPAWADKLRWGLVGRREVVLEGGLQQVGRFVYDGM